jgi:Flp pilus assembly protein TadB
MLDDREQRILKDIERRLEVDPDLVRFERRFQRRCVPWWQTAVLVLGLLSGIFLMTLAVVGHGLLLVAVAAIPLARWCWRRRRANGGSSPHR